VSISGNPDRQTPPTPSRIAVDRVVGGVEVQDDPRGSAGCAWRNSVTSSRSTAWVFQSIFLYRLSWPAPMGVSSRVLARAKLKGDWPRM
jgi:hypothetical protein